MNASSKPFIRSYILDGHVIISSIVCITVVFVRLFFVLYVACFVYVLLEGIII